MCVTDRSRSMSRQVSHEVSRLPPFFVTFALCFCYFIGHGMCSLHVTRCVTRLVTLSVTFAPVFCILCVMPRVTLDVTRSVTFAPLFCHAKCHAMDALKEFLLLPFGSGLFVTFHDAHFTLLRYCRGFPAHLNLAF